MWSYFLVPVTTRAAEFWTAWSFFTRPSACVSCLCQLSVAEADYDCPRAVSSSLSGMRHISKNVLSPCLHHWLGTGCKKRSGIFSRCNCLSLASRLTCSVALPDTGKQDTDTDVVTADISRPCNDFATLRRVINWRIYYYYYTISAQLAVQNFQLHAVINYLTFLFTRRPL